MRFGKLQDCFTENNLFFEELKHLAFHLNYEYKENEIPEQKTYFLKITKNQPVRITKQTSEVIRLKGKHFPVVTIKKVSTAEWLILQIKEDWVANALYEVLSKRGNVEVYYEEPFATIIIPNKHQDIL